jgi:hypothetical protein
MYAADEHLLIVAALSNGRFNHHPITESLPEYNRHPSINQPPQFGPGTTGKLHRSLAAGTLTD